MDEDGLPIVGSGVDLTKVSVELTEAKPRTALQKMRNNDDNSASPQLSSRFAHRQRNHELHEGT